MQLVKVEEPLDESVSVALLFAEFVSVTPDGTAIVAVFEKLPVTFELSAPATVKVTLPPLGNVGMTIPAPCIKATVVLAAVGQAAPPDALPQVTETTTQPVFDGSVKIALFAAFGPLLVTTML